MNRSLALMTVLIFGLSVALMSCVTMQVKPTEKNFIAPKVTLESFEIPQYDGYWYFSSKVKPTKGDAGNRGAVLPMSFLFNVENKNPYPILLNGMTFTVVFDKEFSLMTYNNQDEYWIPAGKTDQVRATTLITARSALLGLSVTGGSKLKAKGWSPWKALETWWKGVPEGTTSIDITECSFSFSADGVARVVTFEHVCQGFVKRLRIDEISMDYRDPKKPKCVVVFFLKELSNLHIEIYSSQNPNTPIIEKTYSSEPSGNRRCIKIPFRMAKGKYHLLIKASNVEGEPKSVTDRRPFDVK